MDSFSAFAMGAANQGKPLKVFDWTKAARLIRERKAQTASAGLAGDWEWTGGTILENGMPDRDSYTYLASTWATPELEIDGETIDCFIMQSESPGGAWSADTKWPPEALAELGIDGHVPPLLMGRAVGLAASIEVAHEQE